MTKLYLVWYPFKEIRQVLEENSSHINVLASYYFLRKEKQPLPYTVLLDSGAYSAFTSGAKIDIDEYCQYIKTNHKTIENYFSLDEIGSAENSYHNLKKMERAGLKPIPAFHTNEGFDWLKRYISEGYKYIALGGVAQLRNRTKILSWLKSCFSLIPSDVKVHGFAITSPFLVKKFPFYSIDSSSWAKGGRFGVFFYYDKGKFRTLDPKKFGKKFGVSFNKSGNYKMHKFNLMQWCKFAKQI